MPREPSRRINLMKRFDALRATQVGNIGHKKKCRTTVQYAKVDTRRAPETFEPMAYSRPASAITKERQEIMRELAAKGVNVERIIGVSKKSVITKHRAKALEPQLYGMSREKKLRALKSAAEELGKMNALGFWHNHPHLGNFAWDGRRAEIIDFTIAGRKAMRRLGDIRWLMNDILEIEKILASRGEELLQPGDYKEILRTYAAQLPKAKGRAIYAAMLAKLGWKTAKDRAKGALRR